MCNEKANLFHWVPIGTFEVQTTLARLHASDSSVVLHLVSNTGADRLLLIDPRGGCPNVELPIPNLSRRVLVDHDVVYIQRDQGIVATSFAVRGRTPSAPSSSTEGGGPKAARR